MPTSIYIFTKYILYYYNITKHKKKKKRKTNLIHKSSSEISWQVNTLSHRFGIYTHTYLYAPLPLPHDIHVSSNIFTVCKKLLNFRRPLFFRWTNINNIYIIVALIHFQGYNLAFRKICYTLQKAKCFWFHSTVEKRRWSCAWWCCVNNCRSSQPYSRLLSKEIRHLWCGLSNNAIYRYIYMRIYLLYTHFLLLRV